MRCHLKGVDLGAINQRFEASRTEGRFETVCEAHVVARIRDKDPGLRLSFRPTITTLDHRCPSPTGAPVPFAIYFRSERASSRDTQALKASVKWPPLYP
jgi:hypothetical protein